MTGNPRLLVAIAAALAALYAAFAKSIFNDGDTGWHLAAGDWIIGHRAIPHSDVFSFTLRGHPWVAHEWLAELIMAAAFRSAGWSGLALATAAAFATTLLIAGLRAARTMPIRYVLALIALLASALSPGLLARPHVLAWALLAIWLEVLLRARERNKAPPLAAAALMTVWANLHASFIFGLAIAAAFALEAVLAAADRRSTVFAWGLFGLLSLSAALITPNGLEGLLYPFQVSGMKALPLIAEWRTMSLPQDWMFLVLVLGVAGAAFRRWRRIGIVRIGLLALLIAMGVLHARHQAVFAIVAVMAIVPAAFGRRSESARLTRPALLLLAAVGLLIAAARLIVPFNRGESANWPLRAIAAVPAELRTQPVLNSYGFGGPLILMGIAPFIDGRADMYGDDFTIVHDRMVGGDKAELRAAEIRWNLRWAILAPSDGLAQVLARDPQWRLTYSDRWAMVFIRQLPDSPPRSP